MSLWSEPAAACDRVALLPAYAYVVEGYAMVWYGPDKRVGFELSNGDAIPTLLDRWEVEFGRCSKFMCADTWLERNDPRREAARVAEKRAKVASAVERLRAGDPAAKDELRRLNATTA